MPGGDKYEKHGPGDMFNSIGGSQYITFGSSSNSACFPEEDPSLVKWTLDNGRGGKILECYRRVRENAAFKPIFEAWRNNEDSRLLWISGGHGMGKTMLLSGIVDELKGTAGKTAPSAGAVAYFFCDRKHLLDSKKDATVILRGLICSLSYAFPAYPASSREISPKWLEYDSQHAAPALAREIESILGSTKTTVYLIIDAFDDFGNLPRWKDVMAQMIRINTLCPKSRWLISSGCTEELKYWLEDWEVSGDKTGIFQIQLSDQIISSAVDHYIEERISPRDLRWLKDNDATSDDIQTRIRSTVKQKAGVNFLWAFLIWEEMRTEERSCALKVLETAPNSLFDMEHRAWIISQIAQGRQKYLDFRSSLKAAKGGSRNIAPDRYELLRSSIDDHYLLAILRAKEMDPEFSTALLKAHIATAESYRELSCNDAESISANLENLKEARSHIYEARQLATRTDDRTRQRRVGLHEAILDAQEVIHRAEIDSIHENILSRAQAIQQQLQAHEAASQEESERAMARQWLASLQKAISFLEGGNADAMFTKA